MANQKSRVTLFPDYLIDLNDRVFSALLNYSFGSKLEKSQLCHSLKINFLEILVIFGAPTLLKGAQVDGAKACKLKEAQGHLFRDLKERSTTDAACKGEC